MGGGWGGVGRCGEGTFFWAREGGDTFLGMDGWYTSGGGVRFCGR